MDDISPLIITVLGAAITNAIFMRPEAALIEIFPEHCYVDFFKVSRATAFWLLPSII